MEVIVLEGQAAERRRPGLRSAHAPDVSIPLAASGPPPSCSRSDDVTDLSFPDLRGFLDQLRRDSRPRRRRGRGGSPPRGGRDPPPRHRRRRPRAAVHEGPRRGPAARHQPLRHRPPGPSSPSATRPERLVRRLVHLAETLMPPTAAKLWGARDVAREALRIGLAKRGARAGHGGRDRRRAARPPARPHLLARGRRPLRHAAPRLHGAPRRAGPRRTSACTASTSTTRARPACTGRSARAAASTTPWRRRAARACPSPSSSAARPPSSSPRSRRCRRTCPS